MKLFKNYCLWITLLFICSGCLLHLDSPTGDQLQGTWRLSDINSSNENNNESFEEQAMKKQLVKDGMVLSLFEDKTFTEFIKEGQFVTGQWAYQKEDNTLLLTESGKPGSTHPIKMEKNQFGRQVMKMNVTDQHTELNFIREGAPLKDFKSDPFYSGNNQWRIKPARQESEAELTDRLAAYLKQVALILKAAQERKQDVVSFEFSQGPIQIYNGGIGIYSYFIVPASWKACFYNDSDAFRAYSIYEHYLRTGSFHGAGTGNWIEDDYNILLSIYADLNETKAKSIH